MRKTALLMMAMAAISALAETCHWTGAGGDGYWTNSANWAENRIPGRWLVADAEQRGGAATNGVTGEVAIFGDDLVAGGATTIDFDGVHSISNLITIGTAHRYTYGASSTQYVRPESRRQVVALDLDSAVEGAEDVQVELVGDEGCRYPHRLAWSADRRRLAYSVDHGLMMYIR